MLNLKLIKVTYFLACTCTSLPAIIALYFLLYIASTLTGAKKNFPTVTALNFTTKAQLFNDEVYKFSKVLGFVDSYYVDSVDKEKLVETAVIEMLKELDPHSVYISKEDVKNKKPKKHAKNITFKNNILSRIQTRRNYSNS